MNEKENSLDEARGRGDAYRRDVTVLLYQRSYCSRSILLVTLVILMTMCVLDSPWCVTVTA